MSKADRDLDNEIAAHLAEAVDDYVARGLGPEEARLAALRDFGGVTQVKQVHRDMRGFTFMNWLDFRLGGRMLVTYPGLTIVGGLAMAFAIVVGIVIFQFAGLFLYPSLPLANGDRIVQLSLRDISENQQEPKALYDFISWRDSLRTIDNLGAWRDSTRMGSLAFPIYGGSGHPADDPRGDRCRCNARAQDHPRHGRSVEANHGRAGGLRFGGVWTVVIVAQVAVTVVFPAIVWFENVQLGRMQDYNPGFATEQFLAVEVERDSPAGSTSLVDGAIERDPRVAATLEELRDRVAAQPGVAGVTFADALSGGELPGRRIELGYDSAEAASRNPEAPMPIRYATVLETDTSYLGVLDAPILAGRGFNAADAEPGAQSRSSIRRSSTTCCRAGIPSASRCASRVQPIPQAPASGTRSSASSASLMSVFRIGRARSPASIFRRRPIASAPAST